jgi:hypothetical protein
MRAAVADALPSIDEIRNAFPLPTTTALPSLPQDNVISRANRLLDQLEATVANVDGDHDQVVTAARDLRVELRSLDILELRSAHEAFDAQQHARTPDLTRVHTAYDAARHDNPLLLRWDDLTKGTTIARTRDELAKLDRG